jgi:DNA topoisomerase-2
LSKVLAKKASSKPGKGEDDSMMSRLGKSKVSVTPKTAESCLCLFINGVFDKPEFTGQTKQKLATPIGKLGFLGSADDSIFKKLVKGAARSIDALRERAVSKEVEKLVRQANKGKRSGPSTGVSEDGSTRRVAYDVAKLVDANKAGTKEWEKCSLILTEGDSAKALAVVGMTKVTGQDYFGVLPLKGKFLNSRGMSTAKALVNDEVNRIRKSMGLEIGKDGDKCRRRYGRVIIMTDADDDGIHIQGLCINFFTYFWPKLAAQPGFMQLFITPLQRVFAIKGSAKGRRWMETHDVYDTMFNSKQESKDAIASWARSGESPGDTLQRLGLRMEYYKGLGTHEDVDAKLYFSNLDRHLFNIEYIPARDDPHLDTAFLKSDASPEVRRQWMKDHSSATLVPLVPGRPVRVDEFINGNMVVFSFSVMPQHIPNVMDGLVESHSKEIYTSFNTSLNPKVKVAAFGGRTTTFAGYAHGDKSISDTITKAGQDFVGSNNVPFLVGVGQFGSRRWGGKDAASARYISVTTQDILRLVFPKADDPVLPRVVEDGKQFQPKQYASVVPYLLFNGCSGTSTGWSTNIPAFNPVELCKAYGSCLHHLIARVRSGERDAGDERSWQPNFHKSKFKGLVPWYHGFRGETTLEVEDADGDDAGVQRVTWTGVVHWSGDTTLHILELPPGVWTNDVCDKLKQLSGKAVVPKKKALAAARKGGKKPAAKSRKRRKPGDDDDEGDDEEDATPKAVSKRKTFVVKGFTEHHFENNIHFKVNVEPSTARAWRDDPELMFKTATLGKLRRSIPLSNMVAIDPDGLPKRYTRVEHIMNDHFVERRRVYHLRHAHLLSKLEAEIEFLSERARFILLVLDKKIVLARKSREFVLTQLKKHNFSPRATGSSDEPSFAYLCKMPIDSLTKEELDRLLAKRDKHQEEFDRLKETLPEELWLADVSALIKGLREFYKDDDKQYPPLDPEHMDLDRLTKAKRGGRSPAPKRRKP